MAATRSHFGQSWPGIRLRRHPRITTLPGDNKSRYKNVTGLLEAHRALRGKTAAVIGGAFGVAAGGDHRAATAEKG